MLEVQQFAKLFKDEDDVREKLAILLRNVPGYQGVRITHGSAERGKDLIYYSSDPMSGYFCNVCVVKKDKITGDVSSNHGARTVFHQAEQALDTSRTADDGSVEFARVVFIVSPHECSESAMLSVQGALASRRGSIQFLCGIKLLEMFQKYYPSALIFDSSFLGNYVVQLRSSLIRSDPVRFLMEQNDIISSGLKQFESVYVKQDFKKELKMFEVKAELESPSVNFSSLSNAGVVEFVDWLEKASICVKDEQVWETPELGRPKHVASSFTALAKDVRSAWEDQWEATYSAGVNTKNLWSDPRTVSLPAKLSQRCQVAVAEFRLLTQYVAELTSQTNALVKNAKVLPSLGSTGFLKYCHVEEIAKRHPNILTPLGKPTDFRITRHEVERSDHAILITAAAGHGKTSFCKWRALESIRALEASDSDVVPFYVPLHQLAVQDLVGTAEEVFLADSALLELFRDLCSDSKRILMFFDGLDEVTTVEQQRSLMDAAYALHNNHPNVRIVVTARDHVRGSWLRWLSRIELSELSDAQVEELVAKWLGDKTDDYHAFFEQIEKARTLEPLTRVPLLCTLIIAVFRRYRSLPQTRSRLYEIVVELMCGGWDLAKNVRKSLRFGLDQKREVLTRFAGVLHLNRRREGTEREFRLAVEDASPASASNWRYLLSEVLEDGLVTSVAGNLTFSHLSFQEFLAAKDVAGDPTGRRQRAALRAFLRGDDWWREALSFYLSSTSRPLEMQNWVRSEADQTQGRPIQEGRMSYLLETINTNT
jgi:hypothetical protein